MKIEDWEDLVMKCTVSFLANSSLPGRIYDGGRTIRAVAEYGPMSIESSYTVAGGFVIESRRTLSNGALLYASAGVRWPLVEGIERAYDAFMGRPHP